MSNRPLGNFLLRTMVMVMLVPIILGMVPLSLFPASATPTAPTTNNTSDASALISSLYERVERSVVQISPQFSEFDIFRTPLPTENTAQGYGSGFVLMSRVI
jgi:hypothetical protein